MMIRTKGEQKAYLDGFEVCAECMRNYLTDEGKQKLECYLMVVRNAVGTENLEQEPILNKIRAKIEREIAYKPMEMWDYRMGLTKALGIIDKYKTESEDKV